MCKQIDAGIEHGATKAAGIRINIRAATGKT
jgi:hypothetical protein